MPELNTYSDEQLVQLLTQGDEPAFNEVFKRYRDKLYHFLFKLTHSEQCSEEIVIDIFVKIWLGRELLSSVNNLEAFLVTIARNKGIDLLRTASRQTRLQEIYRRRLQAEPDQLADDKMIDAEHLAIWNTALNQLPPQRKLIYSLRNDQGMSYNEIAAALNLSKNTVRNQLAAAATSIADYLKKQHPGKAALALCLYFS